METGDRLAMIGGFVKIAPSAPHGAVQAQFRMCNAIASTGRFKAIDVFHENIHRKREEVVLPSGVASRLLERTALKERANAYSAIYVANGDQASYQPHELRAEQDRTPLVCEIGTAHAPRQWTNFFFSAWNGTLRDTDGFIFKAKAVQNMFERVWADWRSRALHLPFPVATVIPNGVDLVANRRDDRLRAEGRRQLGLGPEEVAFLTFSRLAPGTKGDYRALLFLWKRIVERHPQAVLILSGKGFDKAFLLHLRTAARQAGLGNHVLMAEDPYEVWPDARERMMSAADVFVHLSTGPEEVSPNSVLEAMAFGLPVMASQWSGIPELVENGENGFLMPTHLSEPPPWLQRMMLARDPVQTNSELGRCVGCDGEAFVRAASALLEDEPTRLEMGRRSRRRAEACFGLDQVAARRIAFFDELSRRAHDTQPAGARVPDRHLVDFRGVIWSMGRRPLAADDVLEVSREDGFSFARGAPSLSREDSSMALVEFVLREGTPVTVGELVRRVEALTGSEPSLGEGRAPQPETWRACSRLLIRLISYGIVRLVPADGRV